MFSSTGVEFPRFVRQHPNQSCTHLHHEGRRARASRAMEVCATPKACPCHERETGGPASTGAALGVRVQQPEGALRGSGGRVEEQPEHEARLSLPVCLALVADLSGLKAEEGAYTPPPPPPSSIPDSICTDLQRAALIIESSGVGWGGRELAHCLRTNQGHWKIKEDCSVIITDCEAVHWCV